MGTSCCKSTPNHTQEFLCREPIEEEKIILQKKSLSQQHSSNQKMASVVSNNQSRDAPQEIVPEVEDEGKEEYLEEKLSNKPEQPTIPNSAAQDLPDVLRQETPKGPEIPNQQIQYQEDDDGDEDLEVPKQRDRLSLKSEVQPDNFSRAMKRPSLATISSGKTMKIGVDLFVNLKQGSITKYYTIGQVLGQGAFGKVWKVTHKTTGLVRAMKQIKKSTLIKEEEQRLFSEMNILKNLDHPNIVKLYELYQDSNSYYLVTEYLCGGELFDRIKKMSYFSERKAADYIRQILMAVLYCHEQKIVHRDLKPENILFINENPESKLKVIDFGTSRKFDPEKQMTKRLGTPYYIAPEVLSYKYNEKCDVWSCGVILYILLCGYPPFTGKNEKEIIDKVKKGKFNFDPEDWDLISNDAKSLIQRMLTIDPDKRIAAKEALVDPWLVKHAPTKQINQKALHNLLSFQAKSIFKQALLSYIASQMTTQMEIDELQRTFQSLDKNHDGLLCRDELIEGYVTILKSHQQAVEQVESILAQVDINQTGQVDFSEFLMAAMNEEKLLCVQKIDQAFKIFDQQQENGDGYLSKQELEQVMGELQLDVWNQILSECDNNNDGRISQDEFKNLLLSKT